MNILPSLSNFGMDLHHDKIPYDISQIEREHDAAEDKSIHFFHFPIRPSFAYSNESSIISPLSTLLTFEEEIIIYCWTLLY